LNRFRGQDDSGKYLVHQYPLDFTVLSQRG
jgi:hypothetical protein